MSITSFADLVDCVRSEQHHYVDGREWKEDWSDAWVAFSDIIGFKARCRISPDSVVNAIVRFHRSVHSAQEAVAREDIQTYQFTDAVYSISSELTTVLKFCSTLQHYCLAQNKIQLESKAHPLAHYLLMVRCTVAHGSVLSLPADSASAQRLIGVQPETLLAGEGIVDAYEIEKKSAAGLCAVRKDDLDRDEFSSAPEIRGWAGRAKDLMRSWFSRTHPTRWEQRELVDFPWCFLRPVQDRDGVWVDSLDEIRNKFAVLLKCADLTFGEFVTQKTSLGTSKHHHGIVRHLIESEQYIRGVKNLKRWSEGDLRDALE